MDAHSLLLFVAAGLLLNLTPGPDVLYIVTNALRGGRRAGVVAACGITAGCFVHIFAAALGVSALLATSATAFAVLKWLGAAYLVYVGLRMLLARAPDTTNLIAPHADSMRAGGMKGIFFRGFWTNALNPKVALFFLAFLPQFVPAGSPDKTVSFLLMGAWFVVQGTLFLLVLVALAARLKQLGASGPVRRVLNGLGGLLFIGLALRLLSARPSAA